ncbi:malate synthase A [Deinococcus peraridilitoris]|uniref:Malate synthase n=1 Tax=Deinococcus peraridilitoris (strain DSM 19664 / LMG 22246 / CIP 109416 / KR-200) TaxID=937777 RepID=K9ZVV8_DEIPD|nr:malate synthase A [Deinococcus peraridilitoris]AFZ65758.1 malate synthase A [Deinococcus peraridilitoris DSM 19664]
MTDRLPLDVPGLTLTRPPSSEATSLLTTEAMQFVADLHRRFDARRQELLAAREARQQRLDAGERPDFLPETADVRAGDWQVSPPMPDLTDRRVEITGPVDRKMIINALNSGAKVFMADFEDASTPTWENVVAGQQNLYDAVRRTISLDQGGKQYRLQDEVATLIVRPRGWHLPEKHVLIDGEEVSGAIFDFGLYFFHNAAERLSQGKGTYFYLPKLESHLEARLWNDIFNFAEDALQLPRGTIRATVLIETILAAFEMDEILYELREHSAGLNCGRWDYIFSVIKKLRADPRFVLPDRARITMETHLMRSYSRLAIQTCHRRGAHAMGGMSAFIPVKNDEAANDRAFAQVRADKEREASDGHDGTWVAHPALVPVAREVFDRLMPTPNQLHVIPEVRITAADLLQVPEGPITEAGVRLNISVALQYLDAWLRGSGAVPINNLMEDAATAEISRAQIWQWQRHRARLDDGREIDPELVRRLFEEELATLGRERYADAATLLYDLATREPLVDFLTLPGYRQLA